MGRIGTVEVSEEQGRLLERHLEGVLNINKTHNLTRITSREEGMLLHIEDSLLGLPEIEDALEGRYADIGTGGGFPGVPVAIMTGRETLLVDSVQKKMSAIDRLLHDMGLDDRVSVYAGRIEELAKEQPESFSLVTARALSSLPSLLELSVPLLKPGGRLVCYKSQLPDNELEHACALEKKLAMKLVSQRKTVLSDGITERCMLAFERIGNPLVKLPRKTGVAQKRPYQA